MVLASAHHSNIVDSILDTSCRHDLEKISICQFIKIMKKMAIFVLKFKAMQHFVYTLKNNGPRKSNEFLY